MTHSPQITAILFTDMVGSTELRISLGEEQSDELRRVHDRLLEARIQANRGRVLRRQGDGLVAAFSAASEALTAAVEIQQAVASYSRRADALAQILLRIGISVGEVSWEDGDCFGIPMVEAARLEAVAEAAQILCSDYARVMARGRGGHDFRQIGFFDLKGLPEPLAVCEVIWEPEPDRSPLPLPSELAIEEPRPFVGRTAELELAQGLLTDPARARLAVLWILGEPGIGKSRLAREFARRTHSAGGVVLFGRCNEDLPIPYQPFLEALQWYVPRVPDAELADRLGDAPAELTRLVPEIGARLSGLEIAPSTVSEIEQFRLYEAVRSWLAMAGDGRPLVIMIDDLHWAGRTTLTLLGHVARSAEPSRTLLMCTARNTSPDDNKALAALAEELDRRGTPSARIKLTGLDIEAIGRLVESVAGERLDDRLRSLAVELEAQTAGNPLFVSALLDTRSSTLTQHPYEQRHTLAVTVRERVARLPTEVARVLQTASVAGQDFDLRAVAHAAGLDDLAALDALEAAGMSGLVDENGTNRYRFRHALVRAALREQLSASRRVRLHLQVGEALEAVHAGQLEDHAASLAYHFFEAIPVGGASRAYGYALLAAETATRLLSHDEAVNAYVKALKVLDHLDVLDHGRFELLFALSEAKRNAGDLMGSLTSLRAAAEEATKNEASEELARAAVAFEETNFWLGFAGDEAIDLLERAERALPPENSAVRTLTLASLSRALDTSGHKDGNSRAPEALLMAEHLGDPATDFRVRFRTTRSAVSVAQAHVSAAQWTALCRQAGELRDYDAYLLSLVQAMWANAMLGDLAAYGELFAQYSDLAIQLRQPRWEYWLDLFRAFRALLAADLREAEQFLQRAEHVGEGFGWGREGLYGVAMYLIRREHGGLVNLAPVVRAATHLNPNMSLWRPGLAALYAESGRLDDARTEYEAVVSNKSGGLVPHATSELSLGFLAEVCAALDDTERAPWLLEQLRPCQERFLVFFGCPAGLGPTDRLLGMLASTLGLRDDADHWHRSGVELARSLGSPLWIAHCLYDYAVHLRRTRRFEVTNMLDEAAAICDQRGLVSLGHRVKRLAAADECGEDDCRG